MKGMLDPVYEEKVIGHAEVRQIFRASAIGNIAGSLCLRRIFPERLQGAYHGDVMKAPDRKSRFMKALWHL